MLLPSTLYGEVTVSYFQNARVLRYTRHDRLRRPKHAIPALVAWRDAWPRHDPKQRERQRRRDGSDALAAIESFRRCLLASIDPRGRLVPGRRLVQGWRPRPRWHGGFRCAEDTLAWLQRRLRGDDVRPSQHDDLATVAKARRLVLDFPSFTGFLYFSTLKPPIRNRRACNRQPSLPPQLRRYLRGRDPSPS